MIGLPTWLRPAAASFLVLPVLLAGAQTWGAAAKEEAAPAGKVELTQRLAPGPYVLAVTLQSVTGEAAGPKKKPTQHRTFSSVVALNALAPAANGSQEVEVVVRRCVDRTEMGGDRTAYDSDSPAETDYRHGAAYEDVLNQKLVLAVGAGFTPEKIDGRSILEGWQGIARSPGPTAGDDRKFVMQVTSLGFLCGIVPGVNSGRPVAPGDEWLGQAGKFAVYTRLQPRMRLVRIAEGRSGPMAIVDFQAQARQEAPKWESRQTGRLRIDIKSGLVHTVRIETITESDMRVGSGVSHRSNRDVWVQTVQAGTELPKNLPSVDDPVFEKPELPASDGEK